MAFIDRLDERAMWATDLATQLKTDLESGFIPYIPAMEGQPITLNTTVERYFPANNWKQNFLAFQVDRWSTDQIGDKGVYEITAEVTFRAYYADFPHVENEARKQRHLMNALYNWLLARPDNVASVHTIETTNGAVWQVANVPNVYFDRIFPRSGNFGAVLVAELRATIRQ